MTEIQPAPQWRQGHLMDECPCGSKQAYQQCCGLYIDQKQLPKTPEALMRSRYTAYTFANIFYIKKTMQGAALIGFDEVQAEKWAKSVKWRRLKIINTFPEKTTKYISFVEFKAVFNENGENKILHECSEFHCIDGQWVYTQGK